MYYRYYEKLLDALELAWDTKTIPVSENLDTPNQSLEYPSELDIYRAIEKYFNIDEIKTLCANLDIDYDNLQGQGRNDKASELIRHCQRQETTANLIDEIQSMYPNLFRQ